MLQKTLKNGFSIPVLGMGTWGTGGRTEPDRNCDPEPLAETLRTGIRLGYTHIDSAEYYAAGFSEEIAGLAIRGFDRKSLFLTSKVWKTNLHYDDVLRACERSLRRFGTDYFDLYLIHQVDPETPVEETIRAMNRLKDQGMIRNIGVSNFAVPRLKRAMVCSDSPIVVNQVHYSLQIRESEGEMLDFCRTNDVMLEAWRPLRDVSFDNELMKELCAKYGKSPQQIALNYVLDQDHVCAITAMRNPAHLPDNLAALDFHLSEEDRKRLKNDWPNRKMQGTVPLS